MRYIAYFDVRGMLCESVFVGTPKKKSSKPNCLRKPFIKLTKLHKKEQLIRHNGANNDVEND